MRERGLKSLLVNVARARVARPPDPCATAPLGPGPHERHGVDRQALTRRALLGGSVLVTASCGPLRAAPPPRRDEDPDLAIVRRVIKAEEALLARYADARRLHPDLATRLDPIVAQHREHLAALRRRLGTAPPPVSAAPRTASEPVRIPKPIPDSPDLAIAALQADEDAAARTRVNDLRGASAALAQLLASVGASEASHVVLLAENP